MSGRQGEGETRRQGEREGGENGSGRRKLESSAEKLDMGRVMRRDTIDPRGLDWVTLVSVSQHDIDTLPPNRLGAGERAVIAYARSHPDYLEPILKP